MIDIGLRDFIILCEEVSNTRSYEGDTKGMSIAASTNDFGQIEFCSFGCIIINSFHGDELRIEHAGQDLPVKGYRLLMKLLRVSYIAEGDLFEGIFWG